jgi:two-component system, OmpR family, response regulator
MQYWPRRIAAGKRRMTVRVLLVDDDVQLGAMLTEYLNREGFDTSIVHDGESAVGEARSGNYSAVILDIMLPRLSGIEVLQRIRQTSRIPVIMLTARGDDVDRVVGLEMGADDYLAKPFYMRELVARLRAVLRRASGEPAEHSRQLNFEGLMLSNDERRCTFENVPIEMTASEFNLLQVLMRAGAKVSSKDELSRTALGHAHSPYDRSVDVHISRLRGKLAEATKGAVEIETIRGIGYRLRQGT